MNGDAVFGGGISGRPAALICFLLVLSVAVLAVPAVCLLGVRTADRIRGRRRPPLNRVLTVTFLLLLSIWTLRFAVGYYTIIRARGTSELRWYEEVFNSLIHALQTISMDEDYTEYIVSGKMMTADLFGDGSRAVTAYGIYASVLNFLAPVFGGAFLFDVLVSFLPKCKLRLLERIPWRKKYYFSELNERALAQARSLTDTAQGTGMHRPVIIFTDTYTDGDDEQSAELLQAAKAMGALCLRDDLLRIVRRGGRNKEYLLIDLCELNNIKTLAALSAPEHIAALRKVTVRLFYQSDTYLLTERQICEQIRRRFSRSDPAPAQRPGKLASLLHPVQGIIMPYRRRVMLLNETEALLHAQAKAAEKRGASAAPAEASDPLHAAQAALPRSAGEVYAHFLAQRAAERMTEKYAQYGASEVLTLPFAVRMKFLFCKRERFLQGLSDENPALRQSAGISAYHAFVRDYCQKAAEIADAAGGRPQKHGVQPEKLTQVLPYLRGASDLARSWEPLSKPLSAVAADAYFSHGDTRTAARPEPEVLAPVLEQMTDRVMPAIERIRCYQNMIFELLQNIPLYTPLLDGTPLPRGAAERPVRPVRADRLQVTVIGMGEIGTEMLLSSYWCGQMLGVQLSLNAVSLESPEDTVKRLDGLCPELLASADAESPLLRVFDTADSKKNPPYCTLHYAQADVLTEGVRGVVCERIAGTGAPESVRLLDGDYFLVATGDDARNIEIAEQLCRAAAAGKQDAPEYEKNRRIVICYVVYDSALCSALNSSAETRLHPLIEMHAVGDLETLYSRENLLLKQSHVRAKNLGLLYRRRAHAEQVQAGKTRTRRAYDYMSSTARAVHYKYKLFSAYHYYTQGTADPGAETLYGSAALAQKAAQLYRYLNPAPGKTPDAASARDAYRALFCSEILEQALSQAPISPARLREALGALEHRRWNAYMRSIGFSRTDGSKDILLKLHPMLTETVLPFENDSENLAHPRRADRLEAVYLRMLRSGGRIAPPQQYLDYKAFDYPGSDDLI